MFLDDYNVIKHNLVCILDLKNTIYTILMKETVMLNLR